MSFPTPASFCLWSEATTELDFGEGTKVRIKNTTVTLKGKFLRNDNHAFKMVTVNEAAIQRAHELITQYGVDDNPWMGQEASMQETRLNVRIMKLIADCKFFKKEKDKLIDMVSNRDTTIRELKEKVINIRDTFCKLAQAHFFNVIDKLSGVCRVE